MAYACSSGTLEVEGKDSKFKAMFSYKAISRFLRLHETLSCNMSIYNSCLPSENSYLWILIHNELVSIKTWRSLEDRWVRHDHTVFMIGISVLTKKTVESHLVSSSLRRHTQKTQCVNKVDILSFLQVLMTGSWISKSPDMWEINVSFFNCQCKTTLR